MALGFGVAFFAGGAAELATFFATAAFTAVALLGASWQPRAAILAHSVGTLLIHAWYLSRPVSLVSGVAFGVATPAILAALPCFWLGALGGCRGSSPAASCR